MMPGRKSGGRRGRGGRARTGRGTGLLIAALVFAIAGDAPARETRVAVAANFTAAAQEIGRVFHEQTGHSAAFSFGPTGVLYAQITQGAPFEVFLAADGARPARAIDEGFAVANSRFTYAIGRLVLFSRDEGLVTGPETLREGQFAKIAIANPATAPYGAAAVALLKRLDVYGALQPKFVQGNSIAQTYQFVMSGSVEAGLVALSQVVHETRGSRWVVPAEMHPILAQDAVLLERGAENEAAHAFLAFLQEPDARRIIQRFGYGIGD